MTHFTYSSLFFSGLTCFDVTTQRQISQGYPGSSYTSVGHDGTLNGQLTDVQKHILENGGRTIGGDGRTENIQPLRAGGEDPLRLRLVFMAEVSNSGKGNSSANQTTKSERQEVHSLASHPSSMNLRVSNQFSPHGDIVRLDSHGILVAQKRRNQAPVPQRTRSSDAGRVQGYQRTGSVIPSPPAKAEARRYKEEAPRPVTHQNNARIPFRPRNMFKPLSPQSPGFTPLERLTDNRRTVNTNPDPPWRPERQRDPITQPRDRVHAPQQPVAARNTGDPYGRSQGEPYPPRNDRYQTRPIRNEGTQARRLGKILSDMGHTRHEPAPLPSRHADSRPYPIQYTIPDSATPTEMRVRRIQQPEVTRAQPRYVDHTADRVRVRPEPTTHYQNAHQPVSSNAGSGVAIPDTYSDRVRAPPQAPRDSGRLVNQQPQVQRTEVRAPSANSAQIPRQPYQPQQVQRQEVRTPNVNSAQVLRQPYQEPQVRALSSNSAQSPRQPYQHPTTGPKGQSTTNATGELVVLSMQENADGTITYTVADPRKAKADRMNNIPVQVKKSTAASNSNVYDQPQQQSQSMYDQPRQQSQSMYDQPRQQSQSVYDQPRQQSQSVYDQPRQQSQSTYDQPRQQPRHQSQSMYDQPRQQRDSHTPLTGSQYDSYQRAMVASAASVPHSYQAASQTQVQQNKGYDPRRHDTPQAAQTHQYHGMNVIPKQDAGTRYNPGSATSSSNTEMHISSV
ncbi:hypothetical protein LOTGIDRAFT_176424, partial [Lottia gigantea]